jgi:hypothetical protein
MVLLQLLLVLLQLSMQILLPLLLLPKLVLQLLHLCQQLLLLLHAHGLLLVWLSCTCNRSWLRPARLLPAISCTSCLTSCPRPVLLLLLLLLV